MEPTLHEGQVMVVDALTYRLVGLRRGDLLVFVHPHDHKTLEVKRVVGFPGETVSIKAGIVSVIGKDGEEISFTPDSDIGRSENGSDYTTTLGPIDYFVLGDNRSRSSDSRTFGTVQPIDMIGRVISAF